MSACHGWRRPSAGRRRRREGGSLQLRQQPASRGERDVDDGDAGQGELARRSGSQAARGQAGQAGYRSFRPTRSRHVVCEDREGVSTLSCTRKK